MEIVNGAFEWMLGGIDSILAFYLFHGIFPQKQKERRMKDRIITVVICILMTVGVYMTDQWMVVQIAIIGTTLVLYGMKYLENRVVNFMIAAIGYLIGISVINLIGMQLTELLFQCGVEILMKSGSIERIVFSVLSKMFLVIAVNYCILIFSEIKLQKHESLMVILIFISTLLVDTIIVYIVVNKTSGKRQIGPYVMISMSLIIVDLMLFALMIKRSTMNRIMTENKLLSMQIEQEKSKMINVMEMYQKTAVLRHDLKHYFVILQGLLYQEKYEEAKAKTDEILGSAFPKKTVVCTGCGVIDSVINSRQDLCEKQGIVCEVRVSGKIPESKELDLGVVLSNILDNAIESEMKQKPENRRIILLMYEEKEMYCIQLKNYIEQSVLVSNPHLRTEKKSKKDHGYGLVSVKEIVKKLDGIYIHEEEEHYFLTEITILK